MDDTSQAVSAPRNRGAGIPSHLNFPVVGLGASAGGLAALRKFLEHMPADTGMAFVVVLHLSPRHESSADKVLQRSTRMPVVQVVDPVPVEANHVYVISPNRELSMNDGYLRVVPAERQRGPHVAIDLFFRALADVHKDRAVGVILSGTGSDGSVGIARLKEQGGVTLAQLPDDAEYDGMPRAALATGHVDFALPVVEMPQKLVDLWRNARSIVLPPIAGAEEDRLSVRQQDRGEIDDEALREIISLLRARTAHDFHRYKRATVLRRIERRLQVNELPDLAAYRDYLRDHPEETQPLLADMLISVTNFFRDREAFEAVERDFLPKIFADTAADEQVRVWVPGCATGEEAYSVAMLLSDQAASLPVPPGFQVFATDIDEQALAIGRAGVYPRAIITDVPPARLRQYFAEEGSQYRIRKPVRERVMFALHNVLRDPPFSRLDMICCRNLLIYLEREVQGPLLEMFHFALRPGGLLFLGSSESADVAAGYFEPVDKKNRIYRALPRAGGARHAPALLLRGTAGRMLNAAPPPVPRRGFSVAEMHQRVLEHYAPPSVIIDRESANIVHVSDRAGRFLHFAGGSPSHNLLDVVHPALRVELRTALFQATQTDMSVEARRVKLERDGRSTYVNMTARPFKDAEAGARFVLVLFDEVEDTMSAEVGEASSVDKGSVTARLEEELKATREQLATTVEQSETTTEELKASNEELQAINEELRSATEELETSKEELQSLNEELITVNYELKTKVEETTQANDDLRNFIASTDIATVFVDPGLRIKRYTPRAEDIFNLIPSDIGRCLLDITHRLDYRTLAEDAATAFETLQVKEREVTGKDGRRFIARVLPYRTGENHIGGAVLTFVDITSLRRAEEQANSGEEHLQQARDAEDFAIITLDAEGRVTGWSDGATQMFGFDEEEMLGEPLYDIYSPQDLDKGVPQQELEQASQSGRISSEHWYVTKSGAKVYCNGVTAPLRSNRNGNVGYAKVLRDMTARESRDQLHRRQLRREQTYRADAQAANAMKDEFLAVMSHELKQPLNLISLNAELIMLMPEIRGSQRAVHAVELIRRSVRGQSKIIDDLLDLSRMRTGKFTLNLGAVDLVSLVGDIVETAQADAASAHVTITLHVDLSEEGNARPLLVRADPVRVEQIFWNLLSNAIKFTPPGGRVDVRVFGDDASGGLVVEDNGQGIEPDFLPRIFDMFGQAAARAASHQAGLGIGLALVRQLVERHGGTIEASSEGQGRGSKFCVQLPRFMAPVGAPPPVLTFDSNRLKDLRILVVDDAVDTVEATRTLLQFEGAQVEAANSGPQALELADTHEFDVVLSDIGMPGMSGIQLIQQLHATPRHAAVKAVALSGFGSDKDIDNALAAGFSTHLTKPVTRDALVEAIAGLAPARRGEDSDSPAA